MKIYVETPRLILREMVASDAKGLFLMDSNPNVHRFLGNKPITEIEKSHKVVEIIRQQYQENGIGRWAVELKENGEFIGWSGLKLHKEEINQRSSFSELGYRFREEYWGKGYGFESAKAALKYGFEEMGLREISAYAEAGHKASIHILAKCGMQFINSFTIEENVLCNWYDCKPSDMYLFSNRAK